MENEKIIWTEIESEEAVNTPETETHEQTLKLMSPMQMVIRRFFRSKLSIVGLVMVVSLFLFCWVGPIIYNVSPTEIDKSGKVEYTEKEVTYTDEYGVTHTYTQVIETTLTDKLPCGIHRYLPRYYLRWYRRLLWRCY